MEKKVSVIVPVYRTLEWLARCVQSITGQTYKNLEIIRGGRRFAGRLPGIM